MQLLSVVFLALSFSSFSEAGKTCKCLPGDSCFPSQPTWNAFARTLSRPLISNQRPFASVCYNTSANFSPSQCSAVVREEFDAATLAALPNTVQLVNFEELVTNGTVQSCPSDPAPGDICQQGRVPTYGINATTVADIQKTITFASKHNLHLVVKNTGHELLGRSFGVGSVELLTNSLKKMQFFDSFVPEKAPKGTAGQHAVTIQPGVNWLELYTAADAHGRLVAGGYSVGGTVGAGGGWPIGGGHSILSPYYGLGADNVIQFTVVLPDASHVTANAYENTDLFWALRGGGGPSFGVVTSLTYKTHPSIPFTGAFYTATANTSDSFVSLLTLWNQHHNGLSDAGWGGVWPFTNTSLFLTLTAQGNPPTSPTALTALNAFYNESSQLSGVNVSLAITVPYKSFQEFFVDNLVDTSLGHGLNYSSFHVAGTRGFSTSWIMPRTLTSPGNATALAKALTAIPFGSPFMVGGGVVANVSTDAAAIAPAFRTSISDMTVVCSFDETKDATVVQNAMEGCHQQILPLRALAPPQADGGQYLNEGDILEEDWQVAQWGGNYEKLLSIKKKIDPKDLFIVYHGVNSEGWDSESVCKST